MKNKKLLIILVVLVLAFIYFDLNGKFQKVQTENNQLRLDIEVLKTQIELQSSTIVDLETKVTETTTSYDYNDIKGGIYCCGWDFYSYDREKDVTIITPISVPILITVKGEIPSYIDFTKADRTHFTFFYKNGETYYPIMVYRVVSKAAIKYGWLSENVIDPNIDLGNGYVVYTSDPNVPSNEYTDDPDILQKMKDFMSLVSFKVVR